MKNKILLFVVAVLSVIEVISFNKKSKTNFSLPKNNVRISIKDSNTNQIFDEDLEEYVIGVVGAEMPASFNDEALKAQAVASRTYAVYKMLHSNTSYDVISDISNQAYQTKEELKAKWKDDFDYYYQKIKDAVLSTKNEVMYYNDEVIIAYYFSMSNGYTEDAKLVFNEEKPYLKSTNSNWDTNLSNNIFKKEFRKDEFCHLLNIDTDIIITNIIRSDTNRVLKITINNMEYSGTELRKILDLRSTDFDIEILPDKVIVTTKGYGHGVGLSQYGANQMAMEGYDYKDILKHYYNGINISKLKV